MTAPTAPVIGLDLAPDLSKNDQLDLLVGGTWGQPQTYDWEEVFGLKSLSDPNSYTTQDTSVFNTGKRGSDMPTQYKKTITGTLQKYVVDNLTHQRLREAGESLVLVCVRMYNRDGNGKGHQGTGFVQWEPQAGDTTALKTNNFTIMMQTWDEIENPASVAATVATITAALPAGKTTGDYVELSGTGFDASVTSVTVGGTVVTPANRFLTATDGTKMIIKLPAGATGPADIVVTKPAGASAPRSYTRA